MAWLTDGEKSLML